MSMTQATEKSNIPGFDANYLTDLATTIVRETIRLGHDAQVALAAYTPTVQNLVAQQLTHSELKACGLVAEGTKDRTQESLKAMCNRRERNAYERQNAQTSRKGWRPRQTSIRRLAEDIAASIRQHPERTVDFYQVEEQVAAMVADILAK